MTAKRHPNLNIGQVWALPPDEQAAWWREEVEMWMAHAAGTQDREDAADRRDERDSDWTR